MNNSDQAKCPACQQPNLCAIAAGQEPAQCWCIQSEFDAENLETFKNTQRCLCPSCGTGSHSEKQ